VSFRTIARIEAIAAVRNVALTADGIDCVQIRLAQLETVAAFAASLACLKILLSIG